MRTRGVFRHEAFPREGHIVRVVHRERLSAPFDVEAVVAYADPDVDLAATVWSPAVLDLHDPDTGEPFPIAGAIEEAEYLGEREQHFLYRLRLRPRFHALAYRVRSRVFQELDAVEIVKTVLAGAGVPADAVEWSIGRKYPRRELCVQYRESELAFVQRLLEDEGIFFLFRHDAGGDVAVVADTPSVHVPIEGEATLPLSTWDQAGREGVVDLVFTASRCPDAFLARDWSFRRPAAPLEARVGVEGGAGFRLDEYPSGFGAEADGERKASDRLAAARVGHARVEGWTGCRRFAPGRTFELTGASPEHLSRPWLIVEAVRTFHETGHGAPGGSERDRTFFRAIPADEEFRPARVTPRPRIHGKELAVVTGPPGEEIHVDELGRIKVHFYWDREGKMDDHASCWLRVQQQNTSGSMILPRVGWEVDVGFLDGDPDRPVVLQKLYNAETMPPYGLPHAKTQSALQSSTSPGGGGTNEIRIEDGSGGMELFVHASKDMTTAVGHDLSEEVTVDAAEEVGLALNTKVGSNEKIAIGASHELAVQKSLSEETVGSKTVEVGGLESWEVAKNHTITCDGARSDRIGAVMNVLANEVAETFHGSCSRQVGAAFSTSVAADLVEAVSGPQTETVAGAKVEIIRKTKQESVGGMKTFTAGITRTRAGKGITTASEGPFAITVGGPVVERCGETFSLAGESVSIVAAGGAELKAGGTKLSAGGSLTVKADALGAAGGPELKLKGRINYQK